MDEVIHLPPYDREAILNEVFCKILAHVTGDNEGYDRRVVICSLDPRARLRIPWRLGLTCPEIDLPTLMKFNFVNYAVKDAYERKYSPIFKLNDDDLTRIVGYLNPRSEKLLPAENKASLSVESFATGPLPAQLESDRGEKFKRLKNFTLACNRFRRLGQYRLFRRITVRFSSPDFETLRNIAARPRLAIGVLKFSYMIPRFYSQDRIRFEELLQQFNEPIPSTTRYQVERERNQHSRGPLRTVNNQPQIRATMAKAADQNAIINTGEDKHSLLYALSRFKKLGQVRLMRVEDPVDKDWDGFLKRYPQYLDEFKAEDWARSCEHAASTLSSALLKSHVDKPERFSSRFMDPSSPLVISPALLTTISKIAPRLRYLELEFVGVDRDERVLELTELFEIVFCATEHLECLHVGFRQRISAPLSLVFHNLHFRELKHIGLHMWHLDSDELISLLRRHQSTLKSIRLRHIWLKQDLHEKNWEKVLCFIRSSIPNLKWISLRGIGYDPRLDVTAHGMGGLHFAPGPQPNILDTDSDDDSDGNWPSDDIVDGSELQHHDLDILGPANDQHNGGAEEGSVAGTEEDDEDEHDTDIEDDNHDLSFEDSFTADNSFLANYTPQTTPDPSANCECGNGIYGWYDLNDNGVSVVREQWKGWQNWTIKSCARHDPVYTD